jgi:hypothetical protein
VWISLDVLGAALVKLCEFKVFILLWILYTKDTISLHPSLRSFYINQRGMRETTTEESTSGSMEVRYLLLMWNKSSISNNNNNKNVTGGANRIESNWIRIESKLIRNWVELVPNPYPIEIQSNLNQIVSNRTSVPDDFLFHLHSPHIIRDWFW